MISKKKRTIAALMAGCMLVLSPVSVDGALFAKKGVNVSKVTKVTIKRTSATKAKVKFAKINKAKGYQVVYAANKGFSKGKKAVNTTKNVVMLKSLQSEKVYYVKIRGFKVVKNKKVYGAFSKVVKVNAWEKKEEKTSSPTCTPPAELATEVPVSTPGTEPVQTPELVVTVQPETTPELVATAQPETTPELVVTSQPETTPETMETENPATPTPLPQEYPTVLPYPTALPHPTEVPRPLGTPLSGPNAAKEPTNTPVVTEPPALPKVTPATKPTSSPEFVTEPPVSTPCPKVTANPEKQTSIKDLKTKEERFKEGMNRFSYDVFEQIGTNDNMFISPFSLSMALSMLVNGSNEQAKTELEQALGITNLDEWNSMVKQYVNYENSKYTKLDVANSIWHSPYILENKSAKESFIPTMKEYYGVEFFERNLYTEDTREEINEWASNRTNGMIPKFLKSNLSEDTKIFFMNAVYFQAKWQNDFSEYSTHKAEFNGKNKKTEVDMMYQGNSHFSYLVKNGLRGIELQYSDNMVMDVFITEEENKNAGDVFSALSSKEKTQLLEDLGNSEMVRISKLYFPKFQFGYEAQELEKLLQNLGIKSIYSAGGLSGISEEVFISTIKQSTKIEVDEYGTKAAAVTGMSGITCMPPAEDQIIFNVNRPFVYVIRDKETGVILFMGVMQDME